eukprot:scaffold10151_cov155-Ochromonas_danica.AAC.1
MASIARVLQGGPTLSVLAFVSGLGQARLTGQKGAHQVDFSLPAGAEDVALELPHRLGSEFAELQTDERGRVTRLRRAIRPPRDELVYLDAACAVAVHLLQSLRHLLGGEVRAQQVEQVGQLGGVEVSRVVEVELGEGVSGDGFLLLERVGQGADPPQPPQNPFLHIQTAIAVLVQLRQGLLLLLFHGQAHRLAQALQLLEGQTAAAVHVGLQEALQGHARLF